MNAGHFAACEAAAAVIMARAKGTAEKMEDWLFDHQGPPILTPDQVKAAARDVAGVTDFDAQYLTALKEIREDAQLGTQLKVTLDPHLLHQRPAPAADARAATPERPARDRAEALSRRRRPTVQLAGSADHDA